MFDSLYDVDGREWQTKAFDCNLDEYRVGDTIVGDCPATFQVEILGGEGSWPNREFIDSYATVRNGVLTSAHDRRDITLPLLNYSGHLVATPKGL
jgi:hypothetical protein